MFTKLWRMWCRDYYTGSRLQRASGYNEISVSESLTSMLKSSVTSRSFKHPMQKAPPPPPSSRQPYVGIRYRKCTKFKQNPLNSRRFTGYMPIYGWGRGGLVVVEVFQHGTLVTVRKSSQNYDACHNRDSIIPESIKWKKPNVESILVINELAVSATQCIWSFEQKMASQTICRAKNNNKQIINYWP